MNNFYENLTLCFLEEDMESVLIVLVTSSISLSYIYTENIMDEITATTKTIFKKINIISKIDCCDSYSIFNRSPI